MGKTTSKSTHVNELVADIINKNILNQDVTTSAALSQTQRYVVSGSKGVKVKNINFVQTIKNAISSSFNESTQDTIQASIANDIIAELTSTSTTAGVQSDAETTVENIIKTTITNEVTVNKVNTCMAKIIQLQEIIVEDSENVEIEDVTFEQVAENLQSCIMKSSSMRDMVIAIESVSDVTASSEITNPISEIIDSVFGGIQGMFTGIFLIIGAAVLALFLFKGKAKKAGTSTLNLMKKYKAIWIGGGIVSVGLIVFLIWFGTKSDFTDEEDPEDEKMKSKKSRGFESDVEVAPRP